MRVGSWTGAERVGGRRPREAVGGWRAERRQLGVAAGQERGEQQKLAWIHGGAVNTRHRNREARRQDRVQ